MIGFLNRNRSLNILILINAIFILGANMFPPIFALFVKEIGGDVFTAGSIWATFSIITGILIFIISRYGDKLKEKEYLIAVGYILRTTVWLGYFYVDSLWQLYALQFILAFGEAFGTAGFCALYSQHLDKGKYIKEWGLWNSVSAIIIGIAALLGGAIVLQFGFRSLFLLMAFLSAVAFIFLITRSRKLL